MLGARGGIEHAATLDPPEPRVLELPPFLGSARPGQQCCQPDGRRQDTEESHCKKPRRERAEAAIAGDCRLMSGTRGVASGSRVNLPVVLERGLEGLEGREIRFIL